MLCLVWTMRLPYIFLLVVGLQMQEACSLSCENGTIVDILADQPNFLTCPKNELEEWRLSVDNTSSGLIVRWENNKFNVINDFEKSFLIQNKSDQQSPLLVNATNNTKINNNVFLVNGTLVCGKGKTFCGLNYVYPTEGVSCTAVKSSWNITVTCNISSAYSSRRIYTCQLIQTNQSSTNETLERVAMVTTSNNEPAAKNEVKVSGFCQFHTKLPALNGSYAYYVNISPGGQNYMAKNFDYNTEWFTVELPLQPKMVCHPAPYVLENTNISCTCNTTCLGQPAGHLTWVTGEHSQKNPTNLVKEDRRENNPTELHHSQTLTLADHGTTWFRCDVTWGGQKHLGENYTANVGYKPRQPQLSLNNVGTNVTVTEGNSVNVSCSADGRPAPTVIIFNAVNDAKIDNGSSVNISTFNARCEDGGDYKCSAENYFSFQSPLTTSLRLQVNCKPRSPDKVIKVRNMKFDLIAYPMPRTMTILHRPSTAGTSTESVVSAIPCTVHPQLPYNFTCIFTEKEPGFYHVLVTNDFGEGNFTLEVEDTDDTTVSDYSNESRDTTGVAVGVAALGVVILAIVFAIIIVAVKRKKSGKRQILPRREEYETPWDLVPLSINGLAAEDDRERLRPPGNDEDIGAGVVVAAEAKQTENDNKESTVPEEMYAKCDKAKKQAQKEEGNEKAGKKYSGKPSELDNDKDNIPISGGERETTSTGQVVNTNRYELAEYSNTSSVAAAVAADSGRWTNQDGLIYTSVELDNSLSRKRPSPRLQPTEYVEVTFKNGKPLISD